jgi:50S ribosomal protein L16 3-hydroxylase
MRSRYYKQLPKSLLGDLSEDTFMIKYWNKKPVLIRQALPKFASPVSKSTLFSLAKKKNVESRLVVQRGKRFGLNFGPFTQEVFDNAPAERWTLLVQDADKFSSSVAGFRSLVDFVPSWKFDDIMISYAVEGGSVGPHVDKYSVFLLQGTGQRNWQIDQSPSPELDHLPNQDLRILRKFKPTDSWILDPGDVLYLPPNVPHHGVAMGECTTWSFGFRSPSRKEMIHELVRALTEHISEEDLFEEDLSNPCKESGEISASFEKRVLKEMGALVRSENVTRVVGEVLTRPKNLERHFISKKSDVELTLGLTVKLRLGVDVRANFSASTGSTLLFVNGERFELGQDVCQFARKITSSARLFEGKIATLKHLKAIQRLSESRLVSHE